MAAFGLDLGTTSISAAVLDEASGRLLASRTSPGPGFLPAREWERLQDPEAIFRTAEQMLNDLKSEFGRPSAIGLTGQMHGIVYVDENGRAVSPLYTWQDGRGDLSAGGERFSDRLSRKAGCALSTGYGCVTDAWNAEHGERPRDAVSFTTIAGYVGMRLTGRRAPLVHPSDGASFGMFDIASSRFLPGAGDMVPQVAGDKWLGETEDGSKVSVAIGDNQASFLGACGEAEDAVLVNIGTGAQVSVLSRAVSDAVETRPFVNGKYLLVGSSLAGGRAYQILEKFFRACAEMAGVRAENLYDRMNALLGQEVSDPVIFDTAFSGTRKDPGKRASIRNLSEDNFTPAALVQGAVRGMILELRGLYGEMEVLVPVKKRVIMSGNAPRRNPALVREAAQVFGMEASLALITEEAAAGAARYALMIQNQFD